MGLANDSSPDLIVHGVLGMERSMDQIREEMRGILERLVRIHSFHCLSISLPSHDDTACLPVRYRPVPPRAN